MSILRYIHNAAVSGYTTVLDDPATVVSIDVTPDDPFVTVEDGAVQFTATATYSDATTEDVTTLATWDSENDAVATVNATGLVTPVGTGLCDITATYASITGLEEIEVDASSRGDPTPAVVVSGASTTNGTVFTTATFDTAADKPFYLACNMSSVQEVPTPVRAGFTFVLVDSIQHGSSRRLCVWRAMAAAPIVGVAIVFTNVNVQSSFIWVGVEVTDADISGTNGSGATVQVDTTGSIVAATTINSTLAAFEHPNNINLTFVSINLAAGTVTPDAQFTELVDVNISAQDIVLEAQWAENQTTCDPTFSSCDRLAIVSIEVKAS